MTLEELQVLIDAQIGPYKKAMEDMKKETTKAMKDLEKSLSKPSEHINKQSSLIKSAFASIRKYFVVGFIIKKLFDVGKYSLHTALEVSAAMNQIKRVMGESTQSFLKWSKGNALAFNLSQADALKYGAIYSNLFSLFIKNTQQLSGYTVKMLQASAIVASATGRSVEDVMSRIRSGMLGNTEAIEDLGVHVNVAILKSTKAFQELANGRSWEQLDFNTQQAIRMMGILEQVSTKFGNTIMQGPTTSLAYFTALMKNAALNIGNALLPVMQAIMPALNTFASILNKATGALATFMQLLFGKKVSASPMSTMANDVKGIGGGLDEASKGAGDLGKGLGGAGKQAKALKKELLGLMGFDEINLLNKDNSDAGGGSGGGVGGGGGIQLPKVSFDDSLVEEDDSAILRLIEKIKAGIEYLNGLLKIFGEGFKNAFRFEGLEQLDNSLKGIGQSIYEIFEDGKVFHALDKWAKSFSYALGQVIGAIANDILAIAIFIAESLNKSLKETKLDIKEWLIKNLEIQSDIATAVGKLVKDMSDIFYDTLTGDGATRIGAAIISAFTYAFTKSTIVVNFLARDLIQGVGKIYSDNKKVLTDSLKGTLDAIAPIFETLKDVVKDTFEGIVALYDEHIKPLIDSIFQGISQITNTLLEGYNTYILPVLEEFGEKFQQVYDEYLKPALDELFGLIGQLIDVIKELWENVLVPVIDWIAQNIMPTLAPILKSIGEAVLRTFKVIGTVIETFFGVLRGLINFITGVFTGDWDKAWNGVKNIFQIVWEFIWDLISNIVSKIYDWITDKLTAVGNFISETLSGIKNTVSNFASDMWSAVKTKVTDIYNSVAEWFGKIPGKISEIWRKAISYLKGINLYQIGKDIIWGLVNGIGSMARAVWDKAKSIARGIGSAIKRTLGINSPSKVTTAFGRFVGQGLYLGIDKEESNVFDSARGLSSSVMKGLNSNDLSIEKNIELDVFTNFNNMMSILSNILLGLKGDNSNKGDIIIQIGDTEFGRFAIDKINQEQERAGMTLLKI